jgi:ADP-ribose pyrophosphatase YjhB (NUDIX family)
MQEETSVDVKIEKSDYLGYRDEPDRDPRAHAISHAFKAEITS